MAKSQLDKEKTLMVRWIPSQSSLKWNEVADSEAKRFAQAPHNYPADKTHTLSYTRKSIAWIREWDILSPLGAIKLYQELGLKPSSNVKTMSELKLKREVLGWPTAARSGHGHFADYHERLGQEEADKQCKCGRSRSRLHPFSCFTARSHQAKLFSRSKRRQFIPKEVLGMPEIVLLFAEWAPETELFGRNRRNGEEEEI